MGWSGGAKVLEKFSVPGRPTNLDYSRVRAWQKVRGGGVVWTLLLSSTFSLFFLPHLETARYRLKYCLKGSLNPK